MADYKTVTDKTLHDIQRENELRWKPVAAENADANGFVMKQPAAEVGDKAVHLPRRASRKWRSGTFS